MISPEGYALTNFHVTSPAGTFMRCGLSDGRVYDAVLVGLDPVGDLAMIRLLGRDDFPYATMADSLKARAGDWCMVIGNPFLLASNLQPTVTWGILSGVGRYQYPSGTLLEYADCLQTDASINPGNSGGPLFNLRGEVVGINSQIFSRTGGFMGLAFSIPIDMAMDVQQQLRDSGRVRRITSPMNPSVPCDPTSRRHRSNPLTFFTVGPPALTISSAVFTNRICSTVSRTGP